MEHVAIDLGGKESQICVRASDGTIVEELRRKTASLASYLRSRPKSRVIVESCSESFAIADAAAEMGHEVRVVAATLVRSLGVGARGLKTDRRDAQVLSEVSCRIDLPSVHVASRASRRRKALCGMRDALVSSRTRLINTVRGWMRVEGKRLSARCNVEGFPRAVRRLFGESSASPIPEFVARQLQAIDLITDQITNADLELATIADEDPVCRRLMSVPGVGPITAVRFVAAVDEVSRFGSPHELQSYLGLVPGEHSSSDHQRRTGITKAGPSALRWTLVQAAWSARRHRPNDPMVAWARQVEQRRGKRIAITALARKLAGILHAIWRDGSTYDPTRGALA